MPKAAQDEALISTLEARIAELKGFTPLLREGKTLPEIFESLLGDLGLEIFPDIQLVRFDCRCSFDRVLSALRTLGEAELLDMIEKDGGAEATCEFCGEVYRATDQHLSELVRDLQAIAIAE
jgi:molecular chaperone Hsp33